MIKQCTYNKNQNMKTKEHLFYHVFHQPISFAHQGTLTLADCVENIDDVVNAYGNHYWDAELIDGNNVATFLYQYIRDLFYFNGGENSLKYEDITFADNSITFVEEDGKYKNPNYFEKLQDDFGIITIQLIYDDNVFKFQFDTDYCFEHFPKTYEEYLMQEESLKLKIL